MGTIAGERLPGSNRPGRHRRRGCALWLDEPNEARSTGLGVDAKALMAVSVTSGDVCLPANLRPAARTGAPAGRIGNHVLPTPFGARLPGGSSSSRSWARRGLSRARRARTAHERWFVCNGRLWKRRRRQHRHRQPGRARHRFRFNVEPKINGAGKVEGTVRGAGYYRPHDQQPDHARVGDAPRRARRHRVLPMLGEDFFPSAGCRERSTRSQRRLAWSLSARRRAWGRTTDSRRTRPSWARPQGPVGRLQRRLDRLAATIWMPPEVHRPDDARWNSTPQPAEPHRLWDCSAAACLAAGHSTQNQQAWPA